MTRTRLFFATDIHGSEACFLKFLNAPRFYKAKVLILGGDLTGKMIIPIVNREDGAYEANFLGVQRVLPEERVEELENQIQRMGFYPYRTDRETVRRLSADSRKLETLFSRLMIERIEQWIGIAEDKLRSGEGEVYISGGNDDFPQIDDILRKSDAFVDPEGEVVKIHGDHEMITCAWTNPTPWKTARECSEEELQEKLEAMISGVRDMENCVFNIHVPPIDSGLDLCQKLDKDLKPIFSGGQPVMYGAGSSTVKDAIERHQPLLGLHGHIHESKGSVRIGRTLCLNPGSEYSEVILRGVIVDLNDKRVRGHLFTSG
jgi:Icc-related predicted phosphoesterase